MLDQLEITGRARTHIQQQDAPRFAAQPEVAKAFLAMRDAAKKDGFDLLPYSSFRDFDTQLRIWNYKYQGRKPLFDINGQKRDYSLLTENQIIECILNWSALPGGSRHHWGTEIDVVDGAVMPQGYVPQLLPEEVNPGGLFYSLHQWLDENIDRFGFFRPYQHNLGGMYPEPWHLSFAPVAVPILQNFDMEILYQALQEADILGKERVLQMMPVIFNHHILNITHPDAEICCKEY